MLEVSFMSLQCGT